MFPGKPSAFAIVLLHNEFNKSMILWCIDSWALSEDSLRLGEQGSACIAAVSRLFLFSRTTVFGFVGCRSALSVKSHIAFMEFVSFFGGMRSARLAFEVAILGLANT